MQLVLFVVFSVDSDKFPVYLIFLNRLNILEQKKNLKIHQWVLLSLLSSIFPFENVSLLLSIVKLNLSQFSDLKSKKDLKDFMRKAGRVTFADILKDREGEG